MAKYSYDFVVRQAKKMSNDMAIATNMGEELHWFIYGQEIIEGLEKILNGEKNG